MAYLSSISEFASKAEALEAFGSKKQTELDHIVVRADGSAFIVSLKEKPLQHGQVEWQGSNLSQDNAEVVVP